MELNINEIIADMMGAIKGVVGDNWTEVKSVANQFMERRKERLKLLADLRIQNEITQQQFEELLKDEKDITEAELHAIAVISKAIAQQAANAALEILEKAVKAAISTAL